MRRNASKFVAGVLLLSLALGLSGCASEKVDTKAATAIIDVRTNQEFAAGHLSGAINIDVESVDFDTEIARLDKSGSYFVYCHSGRRSAIAASRMSELGFTNLTDLGGINDAASKTGLPIVVN